MDTNMFRSIMALTAAFAAEQAVVTDRLNAKAEEARKRLYEANKLPRKLKKRVKIKAQADYSFYKQLAENKLFNFKEN